MTASAEPPNGPVRIGIGRIGIGPDVGPVGPVSPVGPVEPVGPGRIGYRPWPRAGANAMSTAEHRLRKQEQTRATGR
ncbi:hypothetical protein GCM10010433_48440 [Streptomyces pulveraceus]|uniref:Uncharacterized protein n=1 Tax=Streptomyces pulveraceus TaxID=68258 RepID=A0ABW1GL40_9ACTN